MARSERRVTGKKQAKAKATKAKKVAPRTAAKPKARAKGKAGPRAASAVVETSLARADDGPGPGGGGGPEALIQKERRRGPRAIEGVLSRLAAAQTLEGAYHAWDELRLERALALERFAEEGRRLGQQAGFWVGAARAAVESNVTAGEAGQELAEAPPLQRAAAEAEAKLKATAAAVEAQARKTDAEFAEAELHVRAEIRARVQRYAASARTRVALRRHPAGEGRTILHLDRVGPDESVVLMYLLSGKLPTRHGFLFDDSTENVARPPPWLYAEEGVAKDQVRPPPRELAARLQASEQFAPVKGFVPVFIHSATGGPPVLHRLLERGAVMEAEISDGDQFRNVLTQEEAERVAGALLRLQVEGRLQLELGAT
ncbi:MAG TPA: hypothetical protein VFB81_17685 [Myxococcales bacterium]|nr:hypothetical protein [Myxococcales bacterium]